MPGFAAAPPVFFGFGVDFPSRWNYTAFTV